MGEPGKSHVGARGDRDSLGARGDASEAEGQ
jgi:hypothetical protein